MLITLTTDFGRRDAFVGLMKGVILGIAPGCEIVDLSHEVPPQNILAGALIVEAALEVFPAETIHVVVVDPGVGSSRRAVAVQTARGVLIGPDNGVFAAALARTPMRRAVQLTNARFHRVPVSPTFHGRDIFAPVAAHMALGAPLDDLGDPIEGLFLLPLPQPVARGSDLELHILTVDGFGNLVTDLTAAELDRWAGKTSTDALTLRAGQSHLRGICRTFADVEVGRPLAYVGSLGRLEIGLRNGSAAEALGLAAGDEVILSKTELRLS